MFYGALWPAVKITVDTIMRNGVSFLITGAESSSERKELLEDKVKKGKRKQDCSIDMQIIIKKKKKMGRQDPLTHVSVAHWSATESSLLIGGTNR